MQSKATTVDAYLSELPESRREAISAVRQTILENLDPEFAEGMQYGMIGYFVPHSVYPAGYHCDPKQPLPFAALASQKNYMSLYLMSVYGDGDQWQAFRDAWEQTGKRVDMGKCCVRFKSLDDIPLDLVGITIASIRARDYVATYEQLRGAQVTATSSKPQPAKKKKSAPAKRKPQQ